MDWCICAVEAWRAEAQQVWSGEMLDDFLFCLSDVHPRNDLMQSDPVRRVRAECPFVSLTLSPAEVYDYFGIEFTAAAGVGDCFDLTSTDED